MAYSFGRAAAAKAAALMTGSTYLSYALGILVSAIIARDLGPGDYGSYAYVVWMVGVLTAICGSAFNTTAIRFVAESIGASEQERARAIHARIRRAMWVGLGVTACVFIALALLAPPPEWARRLPWFIAITLAAFAVKDLYLFDTSVAKGYGLFTVEAYSMSGVSVLNAIAAGLLAWRHSGLLAYLLLFLGASVGYEVFALLLLRRARIAPQSAAVPDPMLRRMRHHSAWTLVLGSAAVLSNRSLETYLLGQSFGSASVGFFAIAASLTRGAIDIFTAGISTVLMPAMSQAVGRDDPQRLHRIVAESIRYFVFIGLLLCGAGWLAAPPIIHLMYGAKYDAVVPVFRVLLVAGGLTLSDGAFGALLTTTDRQSVRAFVALVTLGFNATFALTLVPRFGLSGAMASAALSRLAYFGVLLTVSWRVWGLRLPWRALGRLGLSATVAFLLGLAPQVLFPGSAWLQFIDGVVFALAFMACSLWLRAWNSDDATLVVAVLDRMPRIAPGWAAAVRRWQQRNPS